MVGRRKFMAVTGHALNVERVSLGLTQAEVAEALHIDVSVVCRWERGERMLSLYDWMMIEQYFAGARKRLAAELLPFAGVEICR